MYFKLKKIEIMDIRKLNIDYRDGSEIELDIKKAHILLKELKHLIKIDDYYRTHFNENQLNDLLGYCFSIVQKAIDIFPDENYKEIIKFLQKRNKKLVYLSDKDIIDMGTIITLAKNC